MTVHKSPVMSCVNAPDITPPAGHYSHVCIANGLAYVSGQLPIDASGKPLSALPFDAQVKQVLSNVDACLKVVGSNRDCLVQVRAFVTDIEHWPQFNKLYAEWIGSHKPARAVAQSPSLHHGAAVEVEAVALVPGA